jgi:hypothetical protein
MYREWKFILYSPKMKFIINFQTKVFIFVNTDNLLTDLGSTTVTKHHKYVK